MAASHSLRKKELIDVFKMETFDFADKELKELCYNNIKLNQRS